MTIDANNNILPLAWAIVGSENRFSWEYLFSHLLLAIPHLQSDSVTIISDHVKGFNKRKIFSAEKLHTHPAASG